MEVKEFERFIKKARLRIRLALHGHLHLDDFGFEGLMGRLRSECRSAFEEETLKENLQEELENYLLDFA